MIIIRTMSSQGLCGQMWNIEGLHCAHQGSHWCRKWKGRPHGKESTCPGVQSEGSVRAVGVVEKGAVIVVAVIVAAVIVFAVKSL